jgi:hypothetical protein
MAIIHLQWVFNRGKDSRSSANAFPEFEFAVDCSILTATVNHSHVTAETLIARGFRLKKRAYEFPRKQDVDKCKVFVQQILENRVSINHSLIHELTHYKFENQFSKDYVRLVLHQLKQPQI